MIRALFTGVAVLALTAISFTAWAEPGRPATTLASLSLVAQEAAEQSVTGKVTAATKDSLTLEVKEGDKTKSMSFVLDDKTKVEGEVKAGVTASVTYRTEGGKNIATQVTVVK